MVALGGALAGCGSDDSESGEGGDVTVFAAASLTEAFTVLGQEFEREHAGLEVEFSFGASSDLAGQIDQGAPADVFASADESSMQRVVDSKMADGSPEAFAGNVLEIALPKGNPGEVRGLNDLAEGELLVAICDLEVPCGAAATEVFEKAGVQPSIDSYEPDVKSVLTKVEMGEVDAGLVYRSDVIAAGESIDSVTIPKRFEVVNTYPIVGIKGSGNPEGARQFIDFVLSEAGQAEMKKWGFREP